MLTRSPILRAKAQKPPNSPKNPKNGRNTLFPYNSSGFKGSGITGIGYYAIFILDRF